MKGGLGIWEQHQCHVGICACMLSCCTCTMIYCACAVGDYITSRPIFFGKCGSLIVHACCCHGLFNECYRHVRNVVHVNFDTDHPSYIGVRMYYTLYLSDPPLPPLLSSLEQDLGLRPRVSLSEVDRTTHPVTLEALHHT